MPSRVACWHSGQSTTQPLPRLRTVGLRRRRIRPKGRRRYQALRDCERKSMFASMSTSRPTTAWRSPEG